MDGDVDVDENVVDINLVDESGSSDDGMEDFDFASDDEEFVENRKVIAKYKCNKKVCQRSNLLKEAGPSKACPEVEATGLNSEYEGSDASLDSDKGSSKVK